MDGGDRQLHRISAQHTFDAAVADLSAELAAEAASESRRNRRLHRLIERESSTLIGVLVEAAERRLNVSVSCRGGLGIQGTVTAVGPDFVSLVPIDRTRMNGRPDDSIPQSFRRMVVRIDDITSFRVDSNADVTGDRIGTESFNFTDFVADVAGSEQQVTLHLDDGAPLIGEVQWASAEVVCLKQSRRTHPADMGHFTYARLDAITALVTP